MKKLIIMAVALMTAAAAYGQGQFLFNTRNLTAGNNVTFTYNGQPASGADLFVEVLAGPDANNLTALTPLLPLNRTGAGAGYTSPFGQIYTTTMAGGAAATVAYRAFQGTSFDTAANKSQLVVVPGTISLTVPPATPNEVALGTATVAIIPEPATWALGLLGLASLLAIRRRK
jgi:hypothetical protein